MSKTRYIGDDFIDWDLEAELRIAEKSTAESYVKALDYLDKYLTTGKVLLDLGCNIASWANQLTLYGVEYEGLDPSPTAITHARKRHPGLKFYHKNALDMDFVERYDIVFTNTVMQHIKTPNQVIIFRNIYTALKPSGVFIMREKDDLDSNTHHSKEIWISLLDKVGLELVEYVPASDPRTNTSTYVTRRKQ